MEIKNEPIPLVVDARWLIFALVFMFGGGGGIGSAVTQGWLLPGELAGPQQSNCQSDAALVRDSIEEIRQQVDSNRDAIDSGTTSDNAQDSSIRRFKEEADRAHEAQDRRLRWIESIIESRYNLTALPGETHE